MCLHRALFGRNGLCSRPKLKLLRGLEKTVAIIHVSGPRFFDRSKRTPSGDRRLRFKECCLAIAQYAPHGPVLRRRHISEQRKRNREIANDREKQ